MEENIQLCNFLASEHPNYKINFIRAKIEEFLPTVNVGEYDLVLCLSILHNISKYFGVQNVQALMADLSQKINVGIFEFALEYVHRDYIPEDYRDFLPKFSFIRELSFSEYRDGGGIKRPLCFASDKYCWFENFGIMKIDNVFYNVHWYLRKQDLICFQCADKFIKFFYVKTQDTYNKAQQEIQFLENLGGQKGLPKLLATRVEQDQNGIRVFIIRDNLEGVTLNEKISSGEEFDRWDVIKQALEWMIFLEERGYYQGDINTKNFIYAADGKLYPIDYEEMRHEPIVLIWPYNVYLRFLIFMNSVLDMRIEKAGLLNKVRLLTALKKHLSPKQYKQIATLKDSEEFFVRLYEILFQSKNRDKAKTFYDMNEIEILATEIFLDDVSLELKVFRDAFENTETNIMDIVNFVNNLSKTIAEQKARIDQLEKIIQEKFSD